MNHEPVVELLLRRWWTVKELGAALTIQPKLARWYVQQIAQHRVVFARQTQLKNESTRGPRPMAYRLFPEACHVQGDIR